MLTPAVGGDSPPAEESDKRDVTGARLWRQNELIDQIQVSFLIYIYSL